MSGGNVAVCCLALLEDKHQMPTLMWQRLSSLMNTATGVVDLGAVLGKLWKQWESPQIHHLLYLEDSCAHPAEKSCSCTHAGSSTSFHQVLAGCLRKQVFDLDYPKVSVELQLSHLT